MKTYWEHSERGFANEYSIGIATTQDAANDYAASGYERIDRDLALRRLAYRGDAATQAYVGATIDRRPSYKDEAIRFIRTGKTW